MADEENEHSFHFDKAHSYRIDGRAWQHGTAIYGRKDKDAGNGGGVITKSKLVSLRDADEFREHVIKVGHRIYDEPASSISTRAGGKKKQKRGKLCGFKVALCVVILKEKVPIKKVTAKSSGRHISVGDASEVTSSTRKKKVGSKAFVFPARALLIMLHAPLQTSVKKARGMAETTKSTGVQKGKTVVEFTYDIEKWIEKPTESNGDDLSSTSNSTNVS